MQALLLLALQAASLPPKPPIIVPPKAAEVSGPVGEVLLSPIFGPPFACIEHAYDELPYAGDALGTDCQIFGGLTANAGFARLYRTDGASNADWYGWNAEVLSPTDGKVVGIFLNRTENVPGTMGKPPASMIQILRDDGILVTLAHIAGAKVKIGDRVTAGQPIAIVGNNGTARAPHIHIGAYRIKSGEPLQIRWDQRAMAKLRGE
jgi:murein DD-endopeptidase MepM/ murein hydrolase activator NlpD